MRGGGCVYIVATNKPGDFPVLGWWSDGAPIQFNERGEAIGKNSNLTIITKANASEIISVPWADLFPKRIKWFAVDFDGSQYGYEKRPKIGRDRWDNDDGYMVEVLTRYHVKTYDLNWRDSLIERPNED